MPAPVLDFGFEDLPQIPLRPWKWQEMLDYNKRVFQEKNEARNNNINDLNNLSQRQSEQGIPLRLLPPIPEIMENTESVPSELCARRGKITTWYHVPKVHLTSGADLHFFNGDGTAKESPSPLICVVQPVRWAITRRNPLQVNAKVTVFNVSRSRYVSYRIVPAIPGRLQFQPDIGILAPRSKGVVYAAVVGMSPNDPTEHTLKVIQDTLQQKDPFLITSTPVLTLKPKTYPFKEFPATAAWPDAIRKMWNHFGTAKFPMADEQLITKFSVTSQLQALMEKYGEINWSERENMLTLLCDLAHNLPLSRYFLGDIKPDLTPLRSLNYSPFMDDEDLRFFAQAKKDAFIDQSKALATLKKEHTGFWIFMTFLALAFVYAWSAILKSENM